MFLEDKREMTEQVKREYQKYLDYMYEYEEENGSYPMHLSNGQWIPYSTSEYLDKTKIANEPIRNCPKNFNFEFNPLEFFNLIFNKSSPNPNKPKLNETKITEI